MKTTTCTLTTTLPKSPSGRATRIFQHSFRAKESHPVPAKHTRKNSRFSKLSFYPLIFALTSLSNSYAIAAALLPPTPGVVAIDIERTADEMQAGYVGESRTMTLTLINADGQESQRKLDFFGFEEPNRHDKTIIKFTFPPDIKDTALLTHENGAEDDDQWLYLPSLKRAKRIASSNKSGSFVGSEFAYEDLVVRQFEKYNFNYLGDDTVDGKSCFVIERLPKSSTSGYSKILKWRYKDNLQEAKSEYFDRKGDLLKTRFLEGHHQVDGFWRSSKITVKNVQTNKSSTLSFDNIKLKLQQDEDSFSVRALEGIN